MGSRVARISLGAILLSGVLASVWVLSDSHEHIGWIATITHCVLACVIYYTDGSKSVTPLGLFSLASMFFIAIPYVYLYNWDLYDIGVMSIASTVGLASLASTTILVKILFRSKEVAISPEALRTITSELGVWAVIGILLLGLGLLGSTGGEYRGLRDPGLFGATSVFGIISFISYTKRINVAFFVYLILYIMSTGSYVLLAFTGFGRLRLAALGFVGIVAITLVIKNRFIKLSPLIVAPMFLIWSGASRANVDNLSIDILTEGRGLASMIGPYEMLVRVMSEFDGLVDAGVAYYMFGASYIYNILFWIPRAVWASKPDGLGRVYVEFFAPNYLHTAHSLAGSYLGEGLVNFGIVGLFVTPFVAAMLLGLINSFGTLARRRYSQRRYIGMICIVLYCVMAAGVADYVWADTNTFTHRTMLRVGLFLVVSSFVLTVKALLARTGRIYLTG